jgi:glycerate kinase
VYTPVHVDRDLVMGFLFVVLGRDVHIEQNLVFDKKLNQLLIDLVDVVVVDEDRIDIDVVAVKLVMAVANLVAHSLQIPVADVVVAAVVVGVDIEQMMHVVVLDYVPIVQ